MMAAGGGGGSSAGEHNGNGGTSSNGYYEGLDGSVGTSGLADALNTVSGGINGSDGDNIGTYSGEGFGWDSISMNPTVIPAHAGALWGFGTLDTPGAIGGSGSFCLNPRTINRLGLTKFMGR